MYDLIDGEEYEYLYFSEKASLTQHSKQFEFINSSLFITNRNTKDIKLLHEILLHYLDIVMGVYGREFVKHIPDMMFRLLVQFANSRQWIYTSILDLIQYNFNDLIFSHNGNSDYTNNFYDVLLIKFVFQYFMNRNDCRFQMFRIICRCTFGFKNKKHVKLGEDHKSSKNFCTLCNAMEYSIFRNYLFHENKKVCHCDE